MLNKIYDSDSDSDYNATILNICQFPLTIKHITVIKQIAKKQFNMSLPSLCTALLWCFDTA